MSDETVVRTREWLLEQLKQAAMADVQQLTCTKERALNVMTDEAAERHNELFASSAEVGLQEFMDAQDTLGGRFAAFVATVGNPNLVSYAALCRMPGGYDDLAMVVSISAMKSLIYGGLTGCTELVGDVGCRLGIMTAEREMSPEERAAADRLLGECITYAVELALSTADNPVILGDATPGVVH